MLIYFFSKAFQTGETKDEEFSDKGKKSSAVVGSSDEEHPRKEKGSSASLLKTSTDKLKALIKEDKERKPRWEVIKEKVQLLEIPTVEKTQVGDDQRGPIVRNTHCRENPGG